MTLEEHYKLNFDDIIIYRHPLCSDNCCKGRVVGSSLSQDNKDYTITIESETGGSRDLLLKDVELIEVTISIDKVYKEIEKDLKL